MPFRRSRRVWLSRNRPVSVARLFSPTAVELGIPYTSIRSLIARPGSGIPNIGPACGERTACDQHDTSSTLLPKHKIVMDISVHVPARRHVGRGIVLHDYAGPGRVSPLRNQALTRADR